ncbi:hypothetical protein ARALYDRAFT_892952 [Arabidopsis lyrata subsp. lyrata]|uniref:Uncharacterized protein n=1 Tax=Arabidopsis lyrata subsp. lyrata TaxID=81972 RepID=D7KS84_ARALL|nr:hypothetical protein ARALYDRAFT_892952 [Arabidopsis lyrata subsp. lyrata]
MKFVDIAGLVKGASQGEVRFIVTEKSRSSHPSCIPSASSSSTFGNACSGSSLGRIIFDAISCSDSSRYRRELREENNEDVSKSAMIREDLSRKAEKLCDLLNLAVIESGAETKKEETLQILKRVIREVEAAEKK